MNGLFIFLAIVVGLLLLVNLKEIKKLCYYFLSSFDTFSKGASANKISACAGLGICIYITKRYTDTNNEVYVLIIWLLFTLLCLGIVVFKQIVELINSYKNGNAGKTIIDEKETLDKHLDVKPIDQSGNSSDENHKNDTSSNPSNP